MFPYQAPLDLYVRHIHNRTDDKQKRRNNNYHSKTAIFTINSLSVNPRKWSITLKQFVGKLPTNCLSVLVHFVGLAFRRLNHLRVVISSDEN